MLILVTAIVGLIALWSKINDTPPFMILMSLNDKKKTVLMTYQQKYV